MKASELVKKPMKIEEIYSQIKTSNDNGHYRLFIPEDVFVENETIVKLTTDQFKVFRGERFGEKNALFVEW